jgi:hypothetical protein
MGQTHSKKYLIVYKNEVKNYKEDSMKEDYIQITKSQILNPSTKTVLKPIPKIEKLDFKNVIHQSFQTPRGALEIDYVKEAQILCKTLS